MAWALAVTSGILGFLAYPRVGWWPLVFVAHVPLLIALDGQGTRRRALLGWTCGTVFSSGMHYWVAGTLVAMSGFPWALAVLANLAYAAYAGLQWALLAAVYTPLRTWSGRRGWLLTVPLAMVLLERLFPVLFPYSASSALYSVPVLLQTSEWTGVSGPSFLVHLAACAMVHAVEDVSRRRASDHLVPTAVAAIWLLVSVWGVARMEAIWSAPARGQLTVALIQPNVTIEEKRAPGPEVREGVWARTAAMTRRALTLRPDLIVWPEGGFPFLFERDAVDHAPGEGDTHDRRFSRALYRLALELDVDLVAGGLRREGDRTRNSLIHFPRGGLRAEPYDKRLLLLFGEHVPFADTFPSLRDAVPGMSHHEAGDTSRAFTIGGFRFVPSVCYEAIYPGLTREAIEDGRGDVLLNGTNDVWFGDTAEAEHHLMLQIQRAIEDRMWLVRSTNSGISAFVDPTGTVRAQTGVGEETVLAEEVAILALDPSFYRLHGDLFLYVACGLAAVGIVVAQRERLGNFRRRRVVRPDDQAS